MSLTGSTSLPRATRTYHVLVMGHGYHFQNWPGRTWQSNQRIRAFAHTIFLKWFGRVPDRRRRSWHRDGFMAEVADRRGNIIQITQINHGDPRERDRYALTVWTAERVIAQFRKEAA